MTEHEKARAWREAMGFSRRQLAEIAGYSERGIEQIESGENTGGMVRYRLCCAAVTAGLSFDWTTLRYRVQDAEIVRKVR